MVFNIRWLGMLVFLFILGCALWGVGEVIHDSFDGYGFTVRGQMRRAASRRTPEQDELIARDFELWKARRAERRKARK